MSVRRVAEKLPPLELARQELLDRMPGGERDRPRVRAERLYHDPARRVASAAAGELCHELEGPFLRPEVGHQHAGVGIDDCGERNTREVMPLRDHLGAQEHCSIGDGELPENALVLPFAGGRVRVEPVSRQLGQPLGELAFE